MYSTFKNRHWIEDEKGDRPVNFQLSGYYCPFSQFELHREYYFVPFQVFFSTPYPLKVIRN